MTQLEATITALRAIVPELVAARHKGQAGKVAVIGGCREYTGAPYFAAISALTAGADLAHVFCSRDAAPVIKSYSPELIVHPVLRESHEERWQQDSSPAEREDAAVNAVLQWLPRMDCLVIGPGLGRDPLMQSSVARILSHARRQNIPLVVDGDGLHLITQSPDLVRGYPLALLTPNVNEFRRLSDALAATSHPSTTSSPTPSSNLASSMRTAGGAGAAAEERAQSPSAAADLATPSDLATLMGGVTVVQKGAMDVISNGQHGMECSEFGSPRRCGGQGDVLAGSIAVFTVWARKWAQQQQQSEGDRATVLAAMAGCLVVRHAAAAAFARKKRSMMASDIIEQLGETMEHFFPVGGKAEHSHL